MTGRKRVLHFEHINQGHEAMGFQGRTDLPDFHIFTLEETYPSTRVVMPPYTLRFYCVMLLADSDDAVVELNAQPMHGPSDTISFQPPGHVSAWVRGEAQRGFIVYFQPEFLAAHSLPLLEDFPFFRPSEINVLSLSPAEKAWLWEHFARLESTFKREHPYRVQMLQAQLLALLYDCKGVYDGYCSRQERASQRLTLATRFRLLLEQHYLTRQSVRAYAELLHVTPNYLSQIIATELGRRAHELIVERLLLEAQRLLRYTDLSVAEIADYLGFDEPTHFGRLFKRELGLTPLEYRRQVLSERTTSA